MFTDSIVTPLLQWRNRDEEGNIWGTVPPQYWIYDCNKTYGKFVGKLVVTEVALVGLDAVAAVETVAFGALTVACLPVAAFYDTQPLSFSASKLGRSIFNVGWITYSLASNFFRLWHQTTPEDAQMYYLKGFPRRPRM